MKVHQSKCSHFTNTFYVVRHPVELSFNSNSKSAEDLKKAFFYTALVGLVLLIPYGILSAIGAEMTLKYEGNEAHVAIDINKSLSEQQKSARHDEITEKEQHLKLIQNVYFGVSAAAFVCIGVLIYNRKRFK